MKKRKIEIFLVFAIGAVFALEGYLATEVGKMQMKEVLDRFSLSMPGKDQEEPEDVEDVEDDEDIFDEE